MAFKLKDGTFQVKCKQYGCPFKSEFKVTQNIMGVTEADVERESKKIAHDMALIKHDAIYGRQHSLKTPLIRKVRGSYVPVGARSAPTVDRQDEAVRRQTFDRGDVIVRKGDAATTVCKVIKGAAYPEGNRSFLYSPGDSFGVAALVAGQTRMANIIAEEPGTVVAFCNLRELSGSDPRAARQLYESAMQDVFRVFTAMQKRISGLEKKTEKGKEQIQALEAEVAGRGGGSKKTPAKKKTASRKAPAKKATAKKATTRK